MPFFFSLELGFAATGYACFRISSLPRMPPPLFVFSTYSTGSSYWVLLGGMEIWAGIRVPLTRLTIQS